MFYSGWEFPAPTFMNVGALSAELRHSSVAGDAAAAYLTQDLLSDGGEADTAGLNTPPRQQPSTSCGDGGDAVRHPSSALSAATEEDLSALPPPVQKQRFQGHAAREVGCVLHLAARAALSFKEMEQQLHRRTTGSSDCFHVKSNAPAMSQVAVVFMECVVTDPSAQQAGNAAGVAEKNMSCGSSAASPATSPGSKATLPALVLGVCQRSLEWYSLPGEAENSIGFYVAQRLIVKNGYEDGDAVKLPDYGRSGVGGSRVNFGDRVGCLVDLVRHQLSFTVNKDIVSTLPLEPSLADGSYYFAIGLARRPQQATDVVVRFYSGAQCLSQDAPRCKDGLSLPRQEQQPKRQPPTFPLAKYVRELALQSVGRCTTFMSGQEGESRIRRSGAASSSERQPSGDLATATSHEHTKAKGPDAPVANALCGNRVPLTPEALRDTRVTALLRDYLSVRGLTGTLRALDAELHELAPAQGQLYATGVAASGESSAGPSSLRPALPAPARSYTSHVLWRPPMPGEAQEAWRSYAEGMSRLRTALLQGVACDADSAPLLPLPALLGQLTLWRPSLVYAFASVFDGHVAAASAGGGGCANGKLHRGDAGAPLPLSPYDWVGCVIHPSLFTLSMLALRQDTRYLVQSYQAVEELWRILYTYLRAARAACQEIHVDPNSDHPRPRKGVSLAKGKGEAVPFAGAANGSNSSSKPDQADGTATRQGAAGESSGHRSRSPFSASFAPTPEAERQAHAAFTSFFTQLVWNPTRALPSPMAHIHRAPPHSCGSGAAARASSRDALASASLDALAALAGRVDAGIVSHVKKVRSALQGSRSRHSSDADAEEFRACAAACAASVRLGKSAAASGNGNGMQERQWQLPSIQPQPQQRPLLAAHVEEAILVLYRSAAVPSPAPSRSSQVCLLQTLTSLHTHTVSTLRQMERSVRSSGRNSGFAVRTALDSINLLDTLLRTVQYRCRQQVWRRFVHAVEDVNQQLEGRLWSWGAGVQQLQGIQPSSPMLSSPTPPAVIAGPRRSRAGLDGWLVDDDAEGGNSSSHDAAIHEDDQSTRQRSRTAISSSVRNGETPPQEALAPGEEGEGDQRSPEIAIRQIAAFPRYEDLTTFMPSLRSLWRRVEARAALEPSLHLVTELFVQELRRSLDLAPAPGWRQKTLSEPCAAPSSAPSSPATVPAEEVATAMTAMKSEPNVVTVKRPSSLARDHSSASSSTSSMLPLGMARPPGIDGAEEDKDEFAEVVAPNEGEAEAVARWFAEELYLSSMYMKRVFKHMSGS
ncbi:hypothetical protein LSCM1_05146 [Leishmania martiniquensis]|uniref:B30.2/SPRY domain-containing protein n=1 Tax=Leishmania martiniquensis TaxID=1580590 RepID=A0A836KJ78_9TRYP|nr:hypothetical protein LSCM1_05146 [Leishmania martiniquensis]